MHYKWQGTASMLYNINCQLDFVMRMLSVTKNSGKAQKLHRIHKPRA